MSGTFQLGPAEVEAGAAVGAVIVPWVGAQADLLRYDAVALPGVRVAPAAAEALVTLPHGIVALGRVEQGVVHGAELELAEARVGWAHPDGWAGIGAGRTHVQLTRERSFESEDLALGFRPIRSRTPLPQHANGVDGALAWPERVSLALGAFWATATADAPHLWARIDATPLGALPERQDGDADGFRVGLGGGATRRDSPLLGLETAVAADATVAWRSHALELGWVRFVEEASDDAWAELRSRIVRFPGGSDLYAAGRGERVTGLAEGEDVRWLGLGRLSWRTPDAWGALFVEGNTSRELGPGTGGPGDVIDLGRAERSNDWVGTGAFVRW